MICDNYTKCRTYDSFYDLYICNHASGFACRYYNSLVLFRLMGISDLSGSGECLRDTSSLFLSLGSCSGHTSHSIANIEESLKLD